MGQRSQEPVSADLLDDIFEPGLGDLSDEELHDMAPECSDKHSLAKKRRKAEQRLEELRLRDELGDYDLELDDF